MDMLTVYYAVHVASVILLTAYAFQALAAPDPLRRRRLMVWTGILAVLALVAGFGLLHRLGYGFPTWVLLKFASWLGLTALAGLAYRLRSMRGLLTLVGIACVLLGVYAVYVLRLAA